MKGFLAIVVVAIAVVAVCAFPSPKNGGGEEGVRVPRQTQGQGYMKLGNNQQGAGGSQVDEAAPLGSDKWKDPAYWEKNNEKQWGGFENYNEKWQNWAQDSNSGNYKLANQQFGAFDNGQFNKEKASDEFFGPDHVNNDLRGGNYTTNLGFGIGQQIKTSADASGKVENGADGKGGFWGRLHCRIHSSLFLNKKHLKLPVPCTLLL